jgi:hypothetical protein
LYFPYDRFPLAFMSLATRSAASASVVGSIVRAAVKDADPDMPIERMVPLREVLQESVAEPRFRTLLLGAFAAMAVMLAAVGLYGLISYSVTQRTREIGIRVALGAQATQVVLPIVREGLILASAGIAIGLGGALAATRLLSTFLFGVSPTDPLTLGGVAVLLLAVALLASYIPSRRAMRIDPITALRAEENHAQRPCIRGSRVPPNPRVHPGGRADPRARDRRDDGDLQRRERRAAEAAAISRARPPRDRTWLARRLQGPRRIESLVRPHRILGVEPIQPPHGQ